MKRNFKDLQENTWTLINCKELSSDTVIGTAIERNGELISGSPNKIFNVENELLYYTFRAFKNGDKPRVVEENLREHEAQEKVKQDIKENPDAEYYMLCYRKMDR